MTQDEIIDAWNKQADYMNKWKSLGEDEKLEWAMKLEREAIQDEYWMRVNSDLENGVKSLNEKAAERFTTYFPELSTFGSWLEARGEA